ncbi:PREDICTED: gephyrin [Cyphomyrmex costatus]|uniref:gephyrin n=1 Tax=Cyphomyrmex costatus TaxID=456900 RepID=UPI0008523148|nr:PREDICTED: gephyrin [Cyphomyrmex costatus]
MTSIRFAILTVSDTCAIGEKIDESGPGLKALVSSAGDVSCTAIVQDDETLIMEHLIKWSDENKADVILTTGGTGFSGRDVTPEATKKVIHKEAPGLSLAMLMSSLKITPMAILSRAVCGIRHKTLIINLPGSRKAAIECLTAILPAIPHAVDLILDNKANVKDTHNIVQSHKFGLCLGHNITTCSPRTNPIIFENVATRLRESPFPMISVADALSIISFESTKNVNVEIVNVKDAYGRILSEEGIRSNCDLPPFRASIKDGYAVLANDGKGRRTVLCGVKAGTASALMSLKPDTCVRVNTGAPIPDEATAVVQVEDTKLVLKSFDGAEEEEIEIMVEPKEGQDIRSVGCDIKKGSSVLNPLTRIGPVEIGVLAACGYKYVAVTLLPHIGILSTGDELQEPGEPLKPGQVYDSNRISLISLLKENGYNSLDFGIVTDNKMDMITKIGTALEKVDVLVTTGSVSMGDRDLLKPILENYFKAAIHFGRVNMKPGKPTTFATCTFLGKKKYILCLPGNPVSALVTAHLFLLPLVNKLHFNNSEPIIMQAKLTSSYNLDPRPEYARAILKWNNKETLPLAYSTGNQISSKLLNCNDANALLMLPGRTAEKQVLNEGDVVTARLISLKSLH